MPLMDTEEKVLIPLDLSEWLAKDELRGWIVEAAEGLNWDNPELIDALQRNPAFEAKALLCTMALAYLTGVFASEDIVRACARPEFRSVRPKLPPLSAEMSAFRKLNRAVLQLVLANVVSRALKSQFLDGELITAFPAGLRRLVVENVTERLNIARHMDRSGEA